MYKADSAHYMALTAPIPVKPVQPINEKGKWCLQFSTYFDRGLIKKKRFFIFKLSLFSSSPTASSVVRSAVTYCDLTDNQAAYIVRLFVELKTTEFR
jgi:hypothetical protein